jgi:toxin ParE1/3/4
MGKFFLRPKAVADLESIWDYTVDTWDAQQAERYLRMLNRAFTDLAENPSLGRSADFIRRGYRRHLAGRHVVFYRVIDTGIDVVRVLHQKMDFDRHL